MTSSKKLLRMAQNPYTWAVVSGTLLGLLCAAYLSGMLTLKLTRTTLQNFQKKVATLGFPPPPDQTLKDTRQLASLSLWGKGSNGPVITGGLAESPSANLPAAKVRNLVLKGIIQYPDGTFEGAFFDKHSRKTYVVRVGDTLGALRVVAIRPNQVIVQSKVKQEAFTLFQAKKKRSSRTTAGTLTAAPHKNGIASNHVVLPKNEVRAALSNMTTFLRQVRIVPYIENGKPQGFQLLDIVPGSIVSKVGLKNGDVVERVNGKAIRSPEDAMKFFSSLESGKGVTLTVKRKGTLSNISIDLK